MVIIMDASTGEREYESQYGEEVLNAGWLPQAELGLQLLSAVPACPRRSRTIPDPENFLQAVYASQE